MDGQGTGEQCCPSSGQKEHDAMRTDKFQNDIGDADMMTEKGDDLMKPQSGNSGDGDF